LAAGLFFAAGRAAALLFPAAPARRVLDFELVALLLLERAAVDLRARDPQVLLFFVPERNLFERGWLLLAAAELPLLFVRRFAFDEGITYNLLFSCLPSKLLEIILPQELALRIALQPCNFFTGNPDLAVLAILIHAAISLI
jgi:hypothetical protein